MLAYLWRYDVCIRYWTTFNIILDKNDTENYSDAEVTEHIKYLQFIICYK